MDTDFITIKILVDIYNKDRQFRNNLVISCTLTQQLSL